MSVTMAASPERQPIFNLPAMTKALLAINCCVFLIELLLPVPLENSFITTFSFIPRRYLEGGMMGWQALVSPVTYQFLHESFSHLAANMLGLVAFGAGVEPRIGRWRLLILYLICGVAGAAAHFAVYSHTAMPVIGASAGVSGLFGAILRFRAFRRGFWVLVGLWFVLNAVTGIVGVGAGAPVAWVAHVGGFCAGLILFPLFLRRGLGAR
jgi:membrane associated rhomboid family serine protease